MTPKISIIVPIYNVEMYIRECIQSIVKQGIEEYEIICVDDGSTDRSAAIIKELMQDESRIKLICQENQGLSCARNTGILAAKGKYICFVDSDDVLQENCLEKLYASAEKNNLDILTYRISELILDESLEKDRGALERHYIYKHSYQGVYVGKDLFAEMMKYSEFLSAAWLLFINRQWLLEKNIMFYPGIIYEDNLFSIQCYLAAAKMEHMELKVYKYRIRKNSIMTNRISIRNLQSRLVVYMELMSKYLVLGNDELNVKKALAQYMCNVRNSLTYMVWKIDDEEYEIFCRNNEKEKITLQLLGIKDKSIIKREFDTYTEQFDKMIKSYDSILLYGAGKVGYQVAHYLIRKGYEKKIECYVVSGKATEDVLGIKVVNINSIIPKQNQLLIITANENHQGTMCQCANERGFKDVLVTNDMFVRYLDEIIR